MYGAEGPVKDLGNGKKPEEAGKSLSDHIGEIADGVGGLSDNQRKAFTSALEAKFADPDFMAKLRSKGKTKLRGEMQEEVDPTEGQFFRGTTYNTMRAAEGVGGPYARKR
jgi:hypothetical protein